MTRSNSQKRIRSAAGGASSALDRPHELFWRSEWPPGRPPRAILGPKMVARRHFFGACWRSVRASSEVNKTLHWLTKIEVRPSFDHTKKRRNFDAEAVRTRFCLPNALRPRPGVVRMTRRGSPDAPQSDLGPTRRPTWQPRWPNLASRSRPGGVPARSRSDAERPRFPRKRLRAPENDISSIFGSPGPLLASIFEASGELFESGFGRSCFACGVSAEMPKTPRSTFSAFYLPAVRAGKFV